jgi:murein DD-endopeptidase MepM/ murein hydrolase activator NlpD
MGKKNGRKVRVALVLLVGCGAAAVLGWADALPTKTKAIVGSWSVTWEPTSLVNGAPVYFRVKAPVRLESLSAKWLEHDVVFDLDMTTKTWNGLAGISLDTPPGAYKLHLSGTTKAGRQVSFERVVRIRRAKYRTIAVTVATKYTAPDPEQIKLINAAKTVKDEVFHRPMTDREWAGPFQAPVEAPISDVFGTRRTFNGEVKSVHQGLDFGAAPGSVVHAVNAGTVLLARPLYFEGNFVVLDHGRGLLTLYLHLSEFKVKEGDRVARGQPIGLVGSTGRATGPHLHFAVRWQGVYLDPALLLHLKLPSF